MKKAFTILELMFVIVVLGILAAVALPKFNSSSTLARVASGKADVAAIRSGILGERQKRLLLGSSSYIPGGTGTYTYSGRTFKQLDYNGLFGGVLTYPKEDASSTGKWHRTASDTNTSVYNYNIDGVNVQFTYTRSDGTFTCSPGTKSTQAEKYCAQMIY